MTIRPVPGGFAIAFSDGGQHVFVAGEDPLGGGPADGTMTSDEALDLAKEIASALMAAWGDPLRSAA